MKQTTYNDNKLSHCQRNLCPIVSGVLDKQDHIFILLDFSLTVKAATLIFISGRGSAISSTKEGKSGVFYNLVKS